MYMPVRRRMCSKDERVFILSSVYSFFLAAINPWFLTLNSFLIVPHSRSWSENKYTASARTPKQVCRYTTVYRCSKMLTTLPETRCDDSDSVDGASKANKLAVSTILCKR